MTTTHTPAHIPSISARLASCIALGGALLLASCGAAPDATPRPATPRPAAAPVVNSYTDTHESREAAWKLIHSNSYNHDSHV